MEYILNRLPDRSPPRSLFYGIFIGLALSLTTSSVVTYFRQRQRKRLSSNFEPRPIELRSDEVVDGVTGLIGMYCPCFIDIQSTYCKLVKGNTPLVRIQSLSNALGVEILGKAEVTDYLCALIYFC